MMTNELMKNGLWGVVDKKNKVLVPFKYTDIVVLDATHFLAKNDSAYGIIDITGKVTVPFTYDGICIWAYTEEQANQLLTKIKQIER